MSELLPGEMMVGALARKAKVSTATINFYVKEGLIPAPRRLNRTRAAYSDLHLRAIRLVRRSQMTLGLSLEQIKRHVATMGNDEAGIAKLEAVGSLQPIPAAWGDPTHATIEHFDPLPLAAFSRRIGVSRPLVRTLTTRGLLRPRQPGRYDAHDAWLVRTIQRLLDAGVELDWLDYNRALIPLLQDMSKVVDHLLLRHAPALRSRELRFRDIMRPTMDIVSYLFNRVHDEGDPHWRDKLFD